jgi:hypothetical protein
MRCRPLSAPTLRFVCWLNALQATLSSHAALFAGVASVWHHKMRVAKGEEPASEQGYELQGELPAVEAGAAG